MGPNHTGTISRAKMAVPVRADIRMSRLEMPKTYWATNHAMTVATSQRDKSGCQSVKAIRPSRAKWRPSAVRITTIGLDFAKNVFQVHGVGATGQVVVGKSLRAQMLTLFAKLPPCLVGIEACGTSHHNKFPPLVKTRARRRIRRRNLVANR
jgi:hypothetical protein